MNTQADPFSKYRLNQSKPSSEPSLNSSEEIQDPFRKYKIKKTEEDSSFGDIGRHASRIGSRVAETIGGIPGDIQDLIQSGVFYGLEKLTGHEVTPELRKEAKIKSEAAPSTQELKEISHKLTKGYTKARSPEEETIDEYASTVASLLGPMKFRKALGVAALGVGAKKGVESLGLGEGSQEATKLGTMMIASMFNPKGVKQLYTNYYNEALKHAPESAMISAKPLENSLATLKKTMSEGLQSPSEKSILSVIDNLYEKIRDGKVSLREMMASNRSINEIMGDPEFLTRAKTQLLKLKKAINSTISQYPDAEYQKLWKSANEAYGGYHQSRKMSNFISKNLGTHPIKHAIFASIAETAGGYPEAVIPTLGGAGAAYVGIKGIELGQRIMSNPTLRKYYLDMLVDASKENARGMIKSANKLEKSLSEK